MASIGHNNAILADPRTLPFFLVASRIFPFLKVECQLVVVYIWREDNIRIISARKAVRYEVRQYEGEI
ncbi:MAG: BrnT family toxin [Deltaproteobacteria bacterium]|nr:BrnT family toxin [Deltaproteobacteria bacterium]